MDRATLLMTDRLLGGYKKGVSAVWERKEEKRRGSAAARLLGLRVRIPPWVSMFVFCECCVLLCRGL
jgi:hypothetical protein